MSAKLKALLEIADDSFNQLDACRETLRQLESLLWTLKTELGESRTGRLAAIGAYVALDRGDLVEADLGHWREQLEALEVSE